MCRRIVVVALCSLAMTLGAFGGGAGGDTGALEDAGNWVKERGWSEGFDTTTKRLVVVASSGFHAPASPRAFVEARRAAFDRAMVDARRSGAEFLAAEVEAAAESRTSLQEVIGDPELAKALTGAAADEAFRSSAEFSEGVQVVARACVAGMYASQTFESVDADGDARVAVVAVCSPGSVAAMLGRASGPCDHRSLGDWFASLEASALARTFGVRFEFDKECNMRPVAFGQAAVRPGSMGLDDALNLAREDAVSQLNGALRQAVASSALSESVMKATEATGAPDTFSSVRAYEKSIETASVARFGIEVVGRRTVKDPSTGADVVVVAVSIAVPKPESGKEPPPSAPAAPVPVAVKGGASGAGCPPVPERMAHAVRQVQASGTGPNKSAALANALLEAVRREGTLVEGNSVLKRQYQEAMESIGDEVREKSASQLSQASTVRTFANGFIYSYEVLNEAEGSGVWEVGVCANLVRFDPKDPRFGLPPTVAVMPWSCVAANVKIGGSTASCEEVTGACERAIDETFVGTRAFMVLAERDWAELGVVRREIAERVGSGRAEEVEALKLGKELTADFVFIGRVSGAEWTGEPGQRPRAIAANDRAWATVSGRLVNVATGEVAWSKEATVTLKGRDLIDVRNGKNLKNPSEPNLSPIQLALSRALGELSQSLVEAFPPKGKPPAGASAAAATGPAPVKILRVARGMVTLDASNPAVAVGARFAVNLLVDVTIGGRVEIDRDHVATIEVISVDGALAKARIVEGDEQFIDPEACEAVPERRGN